MHTLDISSIRHGLIDEKRHGSHEGASVRKRNGLYYLVFSDITRGRPTCLGYAVSKSPLGPFEYKGIIIDNIGCDPETWNNHGSITEFKGQWYVFYHRSSQRSRYSRRLCIEPIHFEADGSIPEILPTTQGTEPPLCPGLIVAADACRLAGNGSKSHICPDTLHPGEEVVAIVSVNGSAAYRYINFDQPVSEALLEIETNGGGMIKIWADDVCMGAAALSPHTGTPRDNQLPCLQHIRRAYTISGMDTNRRQHGDSQDHPIPLTFLSHHEHTLQKSETTRRQPNEILPNVCTTSGRILHPFMLAAS